MDLTKPPQKLNPAELKILLVDDDATTLKLLKKVLTSAGYQCESVGSGEDALIKIKEFNPDLVLTDYRMSGITGLELLKKIHEDGLPIGVILMTGSLGLEPAIEAIRLGAYEYLIKPISNKSLLLSVERVLSKSKLLVENERFHSYLEKTFRRYVDPGVLSVLIAEHKMTAFESKRLTASVFFSDIRNFSELSANMDVKGLIELLNEYYFQPASEIILANSGTIDKFIGDAVMAVFGAPIPFEGTAEKAVSAALALVETLEKTYSKGLHPFKIGVGIATGDVVSGNIGSPQRMDFTVMGNTVTIAARLEKLAGPGMILIDTSTRQFVGPEYLVSNPLNVLLKGQKNSIDLFEVRAASKPVELKSIEEIRK